MVGGEIGQLLMKCKVQDKGVLRHEGLFQELHTPPLSKIALEKGDCSKQGPGVETPSPHPTPTHS
jgi:hypothetical protein